MLIDDFVNYPHVAALYELNDSCGFKPDTTASWEVYLNLKHQKLRVKEIIMPVTIRKVDGHRVSTPGGVKAKSTTKAKAKRQANLLRAVEHGWKPTGKPARDVRKRGKK